MWLALLLGCAPQAAEPPSQAPDGFWDHWGDGRAELASYRLVQPRYGEPRDGEVVLITVTEEFTRASLVKSDGGHGDEFPVVKLNDTRDFQTGIYDYHAMTSTFLPLDGSANRGQAAKVAFSMQEWCGTTWEQLLVRGRGVERTLHSYFDKEADQEDRLDLPAGAVFADAMPLLVRGLVGPLLPPGGVKEVPWFDRLLDRRMLHRRGGWTTATLRRSVTPESRAVPAGTMPAWTWTAETTSGTWTWWVEDAAPHRLLGWRSSTGEQAELLATVREPYWNQSANGMEIGRKELELPARAWPAAPTGAEVLSLTTLDGVSLEADYYPAPPGAPAALLLHMIPPHWERSSWPAAFIEGLRAKGWAVLALDRRGAGASGGDPEEAYTGPGGRLDVAAAIGALRARGVGEHLIVLGASNGSTSAVDYATWSASSGLPQPAGLVLMTGGSYTEAQQPMSAVAGFPVLFTYSTEERAWSEAQRGGSDRWTFMEVEKGAHGTKMFEAHPPFAEDLLQWMEQTR